MNWDENSNPTATVDFDWSHVDHAVFGMIDAALTKAELACECQAQIWDWVYQPPCQDLDGFLCRCIVCCWIFVPQLREYSMTEMAGRFGKKKQSLGRWVDDFKRRFPELTAHLQHIKSNEHPTDGQ